MKSKVLGSFRAAVCGSRTAPGLLFGMTAMAAAAVPGSFAAGWRAQSFPQVRGVRSVRISTQIAHSGHRSLALAVALDGRIRSQREGEAFVDLRYSPPSGESAPEDLSSHTITAWLYAPAGLAGPIHNPNGVRLFVKDSRWRSEYGPWTHIHGGGWTRLTFTPTAGAPPAGFRTPGFDPHQVILLGVSIAVGGGSGSRFSGAAYLDDVAWGSRVKYDFEAAAAHNVGQRE